MNKRIIAIASFLLTLIPLDAKANYDALHINKDVYTDLDYQFVVPGNPGQIREFKYEATKESIVNADNCGWKEFYINSTSSSLVAVNSYTVAAAENQTTEPLCRFGGNGFNEQAPYGGKTIGYSAKVGNSLWVKLGNSVITQTVQIKYLKIKKVTIGECGFYAFKIPVMTGTTVLLDGVSSTIATLPRTSKKQYCQRISGVKRLYRPLSF